MSWRRIHGICLVWLGLQALAMGAEPAPERLGFQAGRAAALPPLARYDKPAQFNRFAERLDYIHNHFQWEMQRHVRWLDIFLARDDERIVPTPPGRFRLTWYADLRHEQGFSGQFRPDFDADIELPNLQRDFKLYYRVRDEDELPGVDPADRERSPQLGVQQLSRRLGIRSSVGVRLRWPPQFYARAARSWEWNAGRWVIAPRQQFFVNTDDGLGSLSSLSLHRWSLRTQRAFVQFLTAAKYTTETTEGVEWEQALRIGRVREALEDKWDWRRMLDARDLASGEILRLSVFGHASSRGDRLDGYRLSCAFRRPLYQRWIFLGITPALEFKRSNDWEASYSVRFGLDMLFWGRYRD